MQDREPERPWHKVAGGHTVGHGPATSGASGSGGSGGAAGGGKGAATAAKLREKLGMSSTKADKMRTLFMNSSQIYTIRKQEPVNPIWTNIEPRCTREVKSTAEMKDLLTYYGNTDDVMLVRYGQKGCTACGALDKVFEVMCSEARQRTPGLHFYDVQREAHPELTTGLVRYPQVKAFNGGQWADLDFKPPSTYRESIYAGVEKQVKAAEEEGAPMTAMQAEEMYFSVSGPAIHMVLEDSALKFYNQVQVRVHNYFKQVGTRRAWFFNKYIDAEGTPGTAGQFKGMSVLGENPAAPGSAADDGAARLDVTNLPLR
jgi:hypothetical protein